MERLLIALFSTQLLSATPIVVLDPGHGGEYDGAVGVCGLKEKDVVMTVAKETRALLNQMGTVDARLTRSGDHHLPLESRTQLANDLGASLFVSGTAVFFSILLAMALSVLIERR